MGRHSIGGTFGNWGPTVKQEKAELKQQAQPVQDELFNLREECADLEGFNKFTNWYLGQGYIYREDAIAGCQAHLKDLMIRESEWTAGGDE